MPALGSDKLGLMIDTGGCPNRCAHCRVKGKPSRQMSYQEMRWIVQQFRDLQSNGRSLFSAIEVSLWLMEPDFRDDYRELWKLERELNGDNGKHAGLLSIWRIPRDDTYLPWAKEKGCRLCQITLFGVGATHDGFTQRGAFDECIEAMKRLVKAEIVIQWLLIFTKAIIPDLDKLLRIAAELRLPEEAARLGHAWQPVLTDVNPVGRGWNLEHLRPSLGDLRRLPDSMNDRKKAGGSWRTEAEYTRFFLDGKGTPGEYETLWLYIDNSLNVFPQFGNLERWYCLGNLPNDGARHIIEAYTSDRTPGQQARFVMGTKALAEEYGDLSSELLYSPGHLFNRWKTQHCSTQTR